VEVGNVGVRLDVHSSLVLCLDERRKSSGTLLVLSRQGKYNDRDVKGTCGLKSIDVVRDKEDKRERRRE